MGTTEQELESFTQFVQRRVGASSGDLSLDELFDLWRIENPSETMYSENVAAIAASIDDFMKGERGAPAGEHSARLRSEFGLANK
jgi:hypothetical protein